MRVTSNIIRKHALKNMIYINPTHFVPPNKVCALIYWLKMRWDICSDLLSMPSIQFSCLGSWTKDPSLMTIPSKSRTYPTFCPQLFNSGTATNSAPCSIACYEHVRKWSMNTYMCVYTYVYVYNSHKCTKENRRV